MASDCKHLETYPTEWQCADCGNWFGEDPGLDAAIRAAAPGPHEQRFRDWWKKGTQGFELCTLEQAVGSYLQTFPGRAFALLVELLRTPDDPEEHVAPPASRPFTK